MEKLQLGKTFQAFREQHDMMLWISELLSFIKKKIPPRSNTQLVENQPRASNAAHQTVLKCQNM